MSRQFETYGDLADALETKRAPDLTIDGETWKFERCRSGSIGWGHGETMLWATPGWEGVPRIPIDMHEFDGSERQWNFDLTLPRITMDAYLAAVATIIQVYQGGLLDHGV